MKRKSIKKIISHIFIITAICLLLYPAVSDIYRAHKSTVVIKNYEQSASSLDEKDYDSILKAAIDYNNNLINNQDRYNQTDESTKEYMELLNINGNGIMGSISIPKIGVNLPIYHTTNDEVLQVAIGHVQGTSLPIGGEGTHTVLSGHRGMSSAALFTNLPKLEIGDTFQISVLNFTLIYEVDQITTVLPHEIENIDIEEGKEYCTLVTCTPLGINSHRLLVRGHRIETIQKQSENDEISQNQEESSITNMLADYEIYMVLIAFGLFVIEFVIPPIKKRIKTKEMNKTK